MEYCLITASGSGRWGFPKGLIDPGDSFLETALKESQEEAGLYGRIVGPPIGEYEYRKWGSDLQVIVVLMEVSRFDREWEEDDVRERRWADFEEALELICRPTLRELLERAHDRLCAEVN